MPRFEPFAGLRYDLAILAAAGVSMDDVIAPPYDVIDQASRAQLAGRSDYNAVRLELPEPADDLDRYASAASLLAAWREAGVLLVDPEPAFYLYRMTYPDGDGGVRQTEGIIGGLEVSPAESGAVLPHERTMPKPKSDRLDLLKATGTNLSPVWGLSLASGLSTACGAALAGGTAAGDTTAGAALAGATLAGDTTAGAALAGAALAGGTAAADTTAVDDEGVTHELWRITDPDVIAGISTVVASAPVVLADGHHRYETSLAYRSDRQAESNGGAGDYDLVMALVVELAEDQLTVGPIHRLLAGFPPGFDLLKALSTGFEIRPGSVAGSGSGSGPGSGPGSGAGSGPSVASTLAKAGGPALITPDGTWFLAARTSLAERAEDDLDSSRLDLALADLPTHEISYHHDPAEVARLVAAGRAQAGLLIRPATVPVIARAAGERRRLPAKSTFFTPKPRTGMVFRLVR
ncbi:MAG: DUF1015 family protein [Acidimicrobiales bacterium]